MDKATLEQMGCTEEIVGRALELCRKAKIATKPGSGRELGESSTALAPICALFASEELQSDEITLENAHKASCLNKKGFNKALQILRAALGHEESSKKVTSYALLLESYISHPLSRKQLESFCKQAEAQLKELGSKNNFNSNDSICVLVYWVCAAALIRELPEVQDYAAAHNVTAKKISTECSSYTRRLPALRKQISQEVKLPAPGRTPSPTKQTILPTPTPRRSARQPQRQLLTKESVKKPAATSESTPRPSSRAAASQDEMEDDDDATSFPETPTKRRRLDTTPSQSPAKRLFPTNNVASSSRLTLDKNSQPPQTPPGKGKTAPTRGSPLKRAILPELEDAEMEDTSRRAELDEGMDSSEDEEPQSRLFRRYRPVYSEHKVWGKQDRRIQRSVKVGEKRKLEFFQKHGNPFQAVPVS